MSHNNLELTPVGHRYEASHHDRLDLIDKMDHLHSRSSEMRPMLFNYRSRKLAKEAMRITKREEVYPMQAYGLATRLAALNPKLAKAAEKIITRKFAMREDMPLPLKEETLAVVTKTVERSVENEDDTITLPRLAIAASMDFMEHKIDELPPSSAMEQMADSHGQEAQVHMAEPADSAATPENLATVIPLNTGYMPGPDLTKHSASEYTHREAV